MEPNCAIGQYANTGYALARGPVYPVTPGGPEPTSGENSRTNRSTASRDGSWTLTRSTDPMVTRQERPTPALLKEAEGKALGAQTFQLVSANAFKLDEQKGRRMEARGLLYRDTREAMLNLTSLQPVAGSCAQ